MAHKGRLQCCTCAICHKQKVLHQLMPGELIREPILKLIQGQYPDYTPEGYICFEDLNNFRIQYVQRLMEEDKGELTGVEQDVLNSLKEYELISKDLNVEFDRELTLGEKMADKVAEFGGSWTFILFFGLVLIVWVSINTLGLMERHFDPYPYILLNLLLSCIAALQAPIIMMSQNRQEAKDRLRAEHDYRVNLKAEIEIRHMNNKIDMLLTHQWQRLLEIQELQMELLNEIVQHRKSS